MVVLGWNSRPEGSGKFMGLRHSEVVSQCFATQTLSLDISLFFFYFYGTGIATSTVSNGAPRGCKMSCPHTTCTGFQQRPQSGATLSRFHPQLLPSMESQREPFPRSLWHFPFTHCTVSSPWPEMSSQHLKIVCILLYFLSFRPLLSRSLFFACFPISFLLDALYTTDCPENINDQAGENEELWQYKNVK